MWKMEEKKENVIMLYRDTFDPVEKNWYLDKVVQRQT